MSINRIEQRYFSPKWFTDYKGLQFIDAQLVRARWYLIIGVIAFLALRTAVVFHVNVSDSMGGRVFLVSKIERFLVKSGQAWIGGIERGDKVSVHYYGHRFPADSNLGKVVAGISGDVVTSDGLNYFINGQSVGTAKTHAKSGEALVANGFKGVIPNGFIWLYAPNKDSLDSRYAEIGLVPENAIIGKMYTLF